MCASCARGRRRCSRASANSRARTRPWSTGRGSATASDTRPCSGSHCRSCNPMSDRLLDRLLTPKIVFGTLAAVVIIASLFTPPGEPDDAAGTLSSLSYEPGGVRGWYEGSAKLGWKVKRREERLHGTLDAGAVYVLLAPEIPPTASEVGTLLDAVRRGAGLIVSAERGSSIADSLHLYTDDFRYVGHPVVAGTMGTPRVLDAEASAASVRSDSASDSASTPPPDSARVRA